MSGNIIKITQGHEKTRRWKVPLSRPDVGAEEIQALTEVMQSGWLSLGPRQTEFEEAFASYLGVKHAIAVNSGTSALDLILKGKGIEKGDRVITTPFSFIASSNAILFQDAIPEFVDIDPITLNIDPQAVEEKILEIRKKDPQQPRAILAVDIFGIPADLMELERIARKYDLVLVEDACEALGASIEGRMAGSFGDGAAFGFYPNKQITTGEGGMISTNDDRLAERCRILRNQGRSGNDWLAHSDLGFNYRLSELACALGLVQIERVEEILFRRFQVAEMYQDRLAEIEELILPPDPDFLQRSWFVYVVFLAGKEQNRNRILSRLHGRGIQASNYFPPIHLQPLYRNRFGFSGGEFPVCERMAGSSIALPFFGEMRSGDVSQVCSELELALGLRPKISRCLGTGSGNHFFMSDHRVLRPFPRTSPE